MKIKIAFTGDFCSKNPNHILLSNEIIDLFETCDIKCLNFEAPLAHGEFISPSGNKLVQSNLSPAWAEEIGFNVISLANNHMFDYGEEGLLATKNAFKNSITIGAGSWDEAYEVKYVTVKGTKIGFLAGTSCDFSSLKDKWTDLHKVGCAWINRKEINEIIKSAKSKCDYLIVLSHGGIEFIDVPLPEWRDRYRELIECGADAVIGSHPHVPQGTEIYKEKPIFYSLGNFFFDKKSTKRHLLWDKGILGVLEIDINQKSIKHFSIPIMRDNNSISIDNSEKTLKHLSYVSNILKEDTEYLKKVNTEVLRLYDKYFGWLLFGANAVEIRPNFIGKLKSIKKAFYVKRNDKVVLHQLREESTRWLLSRALKLKSKTIL